MEQRSDRKMREVGWRGGRAGFEEGEQWMSGGQRTVERRKMKCWGLITSSE